MKCNRLIQTVDPNHVLFCGDMNTDLARTSPHSITVKQFIQDFDMQACIDLEFADVPYTFIGPRSTSRIDHIIASPAIASCVESCGIIDNHLFSDHVPLKVVFNMDVEHLNVSERTHVCRTVWSKASDDQILQYKQSLHDNLQNIQCDYELLTCSDTKCTKHLPALSSVYGEI